MEQQQNTIKPLTLEINKVTWERFKSLVPRSQTLNDAVVQLIEAKILKEVKGGKTK